MVVKQWLSKNVSVQSEVKSMVEDAVKWGKVDILINNAETDKSFEKWSGQILKQ